MPGRENPQVERIAVAAYRIPTDSKESDGTLVWDSTTVVLAQAYAAGAVGLGYSYTHHAAAVLIRDLLSGVVEGHGSLDVPGAWQRMIHSVRNLGGPGIAASAIAAVDTALWDLKARILGLPLVRLLGAVRESVPIYGSGGFTSYPDEALREQLGGWVEEGIPRVKMKVGRNPERDLHRVKVAREAIGADAELYVDANGAYDRKQALYFAEAFADQGVVWFEEPVSSDDLEGLRLLRDRAPAGMEITAGEYGYDSHYFRRMLDAGAVDVLQADITRCRGLSGLLEAGALCAARSLPLSAHAAPWLHTHPMCAIPSARHVEYFHDHTRIGRLIFDGLPEVVDGSLRPDLARAGHGIVLREADAQKFAL
ncbi:MAG: mandelate racemase [Gemmatimonadota bacterium]|nr:mandelate racemase [Gemmatimonadota bacterium]